MKNANKNFIKESKYRLVESILSDPIMLLYNFLDEAHEGAYVEGGQEWKDGRLNDQETWEEIVNLYEDGDTVEGYIEKVKKISPEAADYIKEYCFEDSNDFNESLNKDKEVCVLCGKHINGYGNNPAPLADEGKCCDECNSTKVIPARMKALRSKKKINEDANNKNNIYLVCKEFKDSDFGIPKVGDEAEVEFEGKDINDIDSPWGLDPYGQYEYGEPKFLKAFTDKNSAITYLATFLPKTSKEDGLSIYEVNKDSNEDGIYDAKVVYIKRGVVDQPSEHELVQFLYYIYELDEEDGSELDEVEAFEDEEKAKQYADTLDFPAHVVFVPSPDSDEGPEYADYIETNSNYYDYQIIYRNKKAKQLGLNGSSSMNIDANNKLDYDDDPNMDY